MRRLEMRIERLWANAKGPVSTTFRISILVIVILAIVISVPKVQAWAWDTHYFIENKAELVFSPGSLFSNNHSTLQTWCVMPDSVKNFMPDGGGEADWHWLDAYSYDPLPYQGQYDGQLPWAMQWIFDNIVQYLEAGDWTWSVQLLGAICHFTGDATMPLHSTWNYNPGYNHTNFEHEVDSHLGELSIPDNYVPQELDNITYAALTTLAESFSFTKEGSNPGDNNLTDFLKNDILWNDWIRSMTENRLRAAVQFTANTWYTAMIRAGLTIQAPTLTSPSDGSITTDNTPTFTWTSVNGTSFYDFQLASDNDFTSDVLTVKDLSTTSYTLVDPLTSGEWYWRVRAGDNSTHVGLWSQTHWFTAQANPENTIVIVILHTNDLHSHLLAEGESGGSAYIASIVDNEREQHPGRVLLLDAGDIIDGDPVGDLFYGRSVIEVMNAMRYDVMTVGNHDLGRYGGDYNYGVISIENDYLMDLKGIAEFPMLAANVLIDNSNPFESYVIKEIDNVKIGIIGVTVYFPPPENVQILDPENAVRECIKEIENQVDIIIALTHIGFEDDKSLASNVENIDIIIGGHSHTIRWTPWNVGKTKIVQAGAYGKYVGRILLEFDAENHENYNFSYNLIEVKHPPLEENQRIAEMVENYDSIISPIVDVKIGYTENALSQSETGKKVAESYKENTGADVGYQNYGGIRDSIPAGPIIIRQIHKVDPFGNKLMSMDLRGDYLKGELGYGYVAGAYSENSKWYLENGELIEDNEYYRVAVNDYSGTRYGFTYGENITYHGLCRDAFIKYLKEVFPFTIYIDGNDNFIPANGVSSGSGTENDPYIIENWDISAETAHGIEIRNTTAYFVIRNCYVHDGRGAGWSGIYFDGVINGKIDNNIAENNSYGIHLPNSDNHNIISNNIARKNGIHGIRLYSSNNNTVENNIAGNNDDSGIILGWSNNNLIGNNVVENNATYGIHFYNTYNNFIKNNIVENNHLYGIHPWYSDNSLISNNIVRNNSYQGIYLYYSDNNLIENNTAENNYYGIYLWISDNNYIYHNNIINNVTQAYDDSSNYWDNGYSSGGNYWSDYAGVDENHGENQDIPGSDGIGDAPYYISGDNNKDRYPLMGLSLIADWNLVSFPVVNENTTKYNLFTEAGVDPLTVNMGWFHPYEGYQPVGLHEKLKDNLGYWIKPPSSVTIKTRGTPKENENIYLVADWNCVGLPVVNENTTKYNLFTEAGVDPLTVNMGWFHPYLGYQPVGLHEKLKNNVGYYIKPPSSVTLRLP